MSTEEIINGKIENLETELTNLQGQYELLDSSVLSNDDYSVGNLIAKLKAAIEALDDGIDKLKGYINTMNNNKKW